MLLLICCEKVDILHTRCRNEGGGWICVGSREHVSEVYGK